MKIAVVGINIGNQLEPQTKEVLEAAYSFADEKDEIDLWLIKSKETTIDECLLSQLAVDKIIIISSLNEDCFLPEEYLALLETTYQQELPQTLLFPGDFTGAELSVRFGYRMGGSSLVNVNRISKGQEGMNVTKPVYSNNLQATFALKKLPYVISIAKGIYKPEPKEQGDKCCGIEYREIKAAIKKDWIHSAQLISEVQQETLEGAKIIVAAGRGIPNKKSFKEIERLGESLGGKTGASRPVVMSAWADMNQLLGVSGCTVSPDICIAIAVSGASPFLAGVENSGLLIAINSDKNAPIFRTAHVGIVDDYKEILDALLEILCDNKE